MKNMKQHTDRDLWVAEAVRHCYWDKDINCARTALLIFSTVADLQLEPQIWAGVAGMHGAGCFGAQYVCEKLTVQRLKFAIDFFEKQNNFCFSLKLCKLDDQSLKATIVENTECVILKP